MPTLILTKEEQMALEGINASYLSILNNPIVPPWVDEVSFFNDMSRGAQETYPFYTGGGGMKETVEGVPAPEMQLVPQSVIVRNKFYKDGGFMVPASSVRRDQMGFIAMQAMESANEANMNLVNLLIDTINAGETALSYDGENFFDTAHATGSNLITADISGYAALLHGTVTSPSPEELTQAVYAAINQLRGVRDAKGNYINQHATGYRVLFPLNMAAAADAAFKEGRVAEVLTAALAQRVSTEISTQVGTSFAVQYVSLPQLSDTDAFMIFRTDTGFKPFIRQQEFQEVAYFGPESEWCKDHDSIKWVPKQWCGVSTFRHELACKVTLI